MSLHLHFISIIIGDNPLYGFPAAAPYLDASFQNISQTYPEIFANYSRKVFYKPGINGCRDAGDYMYVMTSQVYDYVRTAEGFVILLTAGCSMEMIPLGDFAREVNLPLLASTASDIAFANPVRYPTIVMFGAAGQGSHGTALKVFAKNFQWRSITILCDALSRAASAAAGLGITCRGTKAAMGAAGEFDLFTEDFDSAINPDYETRLRRARTQSRIIIALMRSDELRKLMIIAHSLNMTNNEYVYINPQPNNGPEFIDTIVELGDEYDSTAVEAFRVVVTVSFVFPNYSTLEPFVENVTEIAKNRYNIAYGSLDKHNEMAFDIPEVLHGIAQVLTELNSTSQVTTAAFRRPFLNRTFVTPVRRVRIGSNGVRVADSVFYRMNRTSRKFEPTWQYDAWNKNLFVVDTALARDWNGNGYPPLNEPVCGFITNRCGEPTGTQTVLVAGISGGAAALLAILVAAVVYVKQSALDNSQWWYIAPDSIHDDKDQPAVLDPGISQRSCFYGQLKVWCRTEPSELNEQQIRANKTLHTTFTQIRNLRHDWAAQFYGLYQSEKYIAVVWEHGRGSLRSLYPNETLMSDGLLRRSLIFSILNGLNQIHCGPLRFHGSLSSITVIIDSRFSAKLCDVSSLLVFRTLCKKLITPDADFCRPPECRQDAALLATPESDIYALGVIMGEIAAGSKLPNSDKNAVSTKEESRLGDALRVVVEQCALPDRAKRPTTKSILNTLGGFRPKGTVVDSLIRRLETHAENLELVVAIRTADLLNERQKADALLAEIIPATFVTKLRNKIAVLPQVFDSATIFFSSMVGFDRFCFEAEPLEVCAFLNELYTFVDRMLNDHDLYKVETIKDGYVVASGLPVANGSRHAYEVSLLALRLLEEIPSRDRLTLPMRIGIHTGPIAAGIVGSLMPRYCLFGDTMNTASRMESHGEASRIHISGGTQSALERSFPSAFTTESRGTIPIKGKGLVETFWINRA